MPRFIDLTGQRFGRLTVICASEQTSHKNRAKMWKCQCDCGNYTVTRGDNLRDGTTNSCGCYRDEQRTKAVTKHGKHYTRLYVTWNNMLARCVYKNAQNYKNYGGRGIAVCDEWKNDFQVFYDWAIANGYADNLTIDRIDVNGNYEPSNCRWITPREQNYNTRVPKDNKSGHKGVIYKKRAKKWYAFIVVNRHQKSLGTYDTYEEAVAARERGEKEYYKIE